MKSEIILYLFYIYLFFQVILFGPLIVLFINTFFRKFLVVKTLSSGFILPFFIFYAKDFELKTSGFNKIDIVKIKAEKIFFWINPLLLFIGKVRIYNLTVTELEVKYVNRIPSIQKIKYMPPIGRVTIKSANLKNGIIDIEDKTILPNYKVVIKNIYLTNSNIDLGIPLMLIFNSEYGYCRIDAGDIITRCENGQGSLQVQGVTWGKLVNLDLLPIGFLKNKIDLDVSFIHNKNETSFNGVLGQIDRDVFKEDTIVKKKKLIFAFQTNWTDYRLPFDLGLRKIISQLVTGLNYGGVINLTINTIAEGILKILKK